MIARQIDMPTSSSSSDDEDFSKFASCAVSADQLEKDAQVEAKKRSVKRAAAIGGGPTAAAPIKKQDGDEDEPTSAGVDAVSAKVRLLSVRIIPATGEWGGAGCWVVHCLDDATACT